MRETVTLYVPNGYKDADDFLRDCQFERVDPAIEMARRIIRAKGALGEISVDPGDGSTAVPLEYVLIRGFTAMGWKLPATAAGDMLDAIAARLDARRH